MPQSFPVDKMQVINRWQAAIVNAALAQFNIPLRMIVHNVGPKRSMWRMDFIGGANIDSAMKKVYEVQDHIIEKTGGRPINTTKEQALFLFASQWLLWMVECGGKVSHPDYPQIQYLMEQWLTLYKAKGGNPKAFGDVQA